MTEIKTNEKIAFHPISVDDKAIYEEYLCADKNNRGCEFSFANLCLWGRQSLARMGDNILLFSQFNRRSVYPYPVGKGDKREVLDAIIADAAARGIPCRITGLDVLAKETVDTLYPGKFRFHCDEGSFDYVYGIDDLAELSGKKYHGKRNHLNRFKEEHPNYTVEPITEGNIPVVKEMLKEWYRVRLEENPRADYHMEAAAIQKALSYYKELALDGLVLFDGNEPLAFTMGSFLRGDTFDVHFEKARVDVGIAYTAINYEFARYIRERYPQIHFLDREEDMGLEGLRKAKKSYHPHHMIEKCWGCLLEDGYDY